MSDTRIMCFDAGCRHPAKWVVFMDRGGLPQPFCGVHIGGVLAHSAADARPLAEVSAELRATLLKAQR